MSNVNDDTVASRRNFLKLAAASAATGGATLGAASATAAAPKAAANGTAEPVYQETEHIRRYYALAR
jgi:anaerobic selenocysteine-containing dehydrogenase